MNRIAIDFSSPLLSSPSRRLSGLLFLFFCQLRVFFLSVDFLLDTPADKKEARLEFRKQKIEESKMLAEHI